MKKLLSCKTTAVLLLLVTVLFLGFYAYMLARPISYGMVYRNETVYEGEVFEGEITFYRNGRMKNENTNFDQPIEGYYYYQDGYVFSLMAQSEAEYEAEVEYIREHFDDALELPFYAARINAFRHRAIGLDDDVTSYVCTDLGTFAALGGALALSLAAAALSSLILSKRSRRALSAQDADLK